MAGQAVKQVGHRTCAPLPDRLSLGAVEPGVYRLLKTGPPYSNGSHMI
jgi:hypothetical protein